MTFPLPPDPLDPDEPGLDEDSRFRRRRLAAMERMSPDELRDLAVRAGILTPDGNLTPPYLDDTPSPYRDMLSGSSLDFPILEVLRSSGVRGPLRHDAVVAELSRRWAVSENEVLGRLRRMAAHGFVDEVAPLCFAVTDAGRAAQPVG